jgi:hypothetical protein
LKQQVELATTGIDFPQEVAVASQHDEEIQAIPVDESEPEDEEALTSITFEEEDSSEDSDR